jgi:exopolysaccharide biosynthesis WecB/TagA/CpsF family protein
MKLLVDIIPYDNGKSGISAYCRGIVRALAAGGHELTLVAETREIADSLGVKQALVAPWWTRKAALSMLWHLFVLPRKIKKTGCDGCLLLAANRRALCRYPIPTVAVVHDLSQYHVEAKYDAFRMFYIWRILPFFVRKAQSVVAISKSTARDLVDHWRIPASRIKVVYDGFDRKPSGSEPAVSCDSILYISRLEHPGKNHVNLIRAYERLPRAVAAAHPLVLTGGDWNGSDAVHAAAEASPYRAYIRLTGFVPNDAIDALWAAAAVYVFPSKFEGFGLSLVEAMDRGVPCCCSKTSSLGEIGEGVAELFDPESPEEIAAALQKLLSGDNAARIAAGRARAAEFSWENCAEGLLSAFRPATVFDVAITVESMSAALDRVFRPLAAGRRPSSFYAFVNAHCLNVAYVDIAYREILNGCDAVWADGIGVRMAGNILGFPVTENVNGTDMFPLLADRCAREGKTMFFFGGAPGVAEKAAENARRDHPGLQVVGICDGFVSTDEALRRIQDAKPDILLVALGVPRQEKWIAENRSRLGCGAAIAVGGLLDFISGRIPRAPEWMRKRGLEWLFRLYQEPVGKFKRYVFGNPLFLHRVRREKIRNTP